METDRTNIQNEYYITWKLYRRWTMEGQFKGIYLTFFVVWCVLGAVSLTVVWIASGLLRMAYGLMAVFCLYRAFLRNLLRARVKYTKYVKTFGQEIWNRTITFEDDHILVSGGPASLRFAYTDIVDIREKADEVRLICRNKQVIGLFKSAFLGGDWPACQALIASKRSETRK